MKVVDRLKDIVEFHDSDGAVVARKGTTCDLIEKDENLFVKKQWHSGDWVFPSNYEYGIEKHTYMKGNALNLPIPRLIDFDDNDRSLLLEYIPGQRMETPCSDISILPAIMDFQDGFKNLGFPADVSPCVIDGDTIHQYRLDQLKYIFGAGDLSKKVDKIYEGFLQNLRYFTIPFDRILHNTIATEEGRYFFDFEWTIAGPYEFTLARIAIEFNTYNNNYILDRVEIEELYHLFLIRFNLYGREPDTLGPYLATQIENNRLRELFELIRRYKYEEAHEN